MKKTTFGNNPYYAGALVRAFCSVAALLDPTAVTTTPATKVADLAETAKFNYGQVSRADTVFGFNPEKGVVVGVKDHPQIVVVANATTVELIKQIVVDADVAESFTYEGVFKNGDFMRAVIALKATATDADFNTIIENLLIGLGELAVSHDPVSSVRSVRKPAAPAAAPAGTPASAPATTK